MEMRQLKTLEIEPLTKKKLNVIVIEKEYDEPLWQYEDILRPRSTPLLNMIRRPSVAFSEFLWEMITRFEPAFITEELGMRGSIEEFYEKNVTARLCKESNVPYYPVDIDEYAKAYLASTLDEKKALRDKVLRWLAQLSKREDEDARSKIEYLTAYGQYLQHELEEEVKRTSFKVRESWIVMGILDHAKEVEKNEVVSIHICSPKHVKGIMKLLTSLNVEVLPVKVEKRVTHKFEGKASRKRLPELLKSLEIQAVPVIKKEPKKLPYILFFLDTDKHASAFDICLAYDSGFDVVLPYGNVGPEETKKIVQDAIFSRGPKGVKHSCFLIGGSNPEKAEEALDVVTREMSPPFETSVIVDPRGAYTTSATIVAKVEHRAKQIGIDDLKGRKTVVLAGTGPVGRVTAMLCAQLGCRVYITSRSKQKAEATAKEILDKHGVRIGGIQAADQEEVYEAIKDAAIIIATGKAGVQLISKETLMKLKGKKLIVDINAVPPAGVAGLKPKDDLSEIAPGIYGIGALVVGDLKYRLEREILADARKAGKGVFSYNFALEKVKRLLEAKTEVPLISAAEITRSPPFFISP